MRVFWAFTRQAFHTTVIYRFEFWLRAASILLLMYSINWVWTILYTQRPGAFGVNLRQMVTYGVLGMAIEVIFYTGPQYYMALQVRTGAIDTDLMKPLDFHMYMLARSLGEMLFRLCILTLPALAVGYFLFDLNLPADGATGLLFAFSLVLGYLVLFHLDFLVGTLALVTLDIHSIDWAYESLTRFFAGQMVPLWLFPGLIGALAEALPFKSIFYIPMSIYIGRFAGAAVVTAIGFQLLWLGLLILFSRWVWSRVHARLVIQGG
jgi:ABC-2 type transport system permease protein